jgi:hypothetical protein
MRERFGETITGVAAADAIANLKQKDTESVDEFYERVVKALDRKNHSYSLAEKATPAYQVHFSHDIFTFVAAGLRETIRARTLGAAVPPTSEAALIKAARSVEAEMKRGGTKREMMQVTAAAGAVGEGESCSEVQQLRKLVEELSAKVDANRRAKSQATLNTHLLQVWGPWTYCYGMPLSTRYAEAAWWYGSSKTSTWRTKRVPSRRKPRCWQRRSTLA